MADATKDKSATPPSSKGGGALPTGNGGPPTEATQPAEPPIRWGIIVPVVLISAVVLLAGLPLGAVFILSNSNCCLANGPENVVTFWASMTAGFLALFGMVVTGVFIIVAFRTDTIARAEARLAADKAAKTYIQRYRESLFKKMEAAKYQVTERAVAVVREIQEQKNKASDAIASAQGETANAARKAQDGIGRALEETTNAADDAQEHIGEALEETRKAATNAQADILGWRQEVERGRDDALRAIDSARQDAEAAATAVRQLADRTTGGPDQTGRDPEGPDE